MAIRQEDPRANQKSRTRAAIVEAAGRLREGGREVNVAEAAQEAGVSRATAYRYFPTQEALLVEMAGITPDVAATEAMLAELATDDVERRLLALLDAFNPLVLEKEADFRRALWVYLDTWLRSDRAAEEPPAAREGRRMRWLEQALEPLRGLEDDERRRLHAALALTVGVDSLVVMKDVCGLDDAAALEVLRFAALAILRTALCEGGAASTGSTIAP